MLTFTFNKMNCMASLLHRAVSGEPRCTKVVIYWLTPKVSMIFIFLA